MAINGDHIVPVIGCHGLDIHQGGIVQPIFASLIYVSVLDQGNLCESSEAEMMSE